MPAVLKKFLLSVAFVCMTVLSFAQINLQYQGSLKDLFSLLQKQYGYKFVYSNDEVNDRKTVSVTIQNAPIENVLKAIANQANLSYQIFNKQVILKSSKKKTEVTESPAAVNSVKTNPSQAAGKMPPDRPVSEINPNTENKPKTGNASTSTKPQPDVTKQPEKVSPQSNEPEPTKRETHPAPPAKKAQQSETTEKSTRSRDTLFVSNPVKSEKQPENAVPEKTSGENSSRDSIPKDSAVVHKPVKSQTTSGPVEPDVSPKEKAGANNSDVNKKTSKFSLQNNLLYDLVLTPNIGMKWKINETWGIVVNGLWTHLKWDQGNKTYRIWAIVPEAHYYFAKKKHFYTGVMFQTGQINLKLSETGHQGDFWGGGLTGGYVTQWNSRFQLDFSIGLGYTYFKYDSYNFIDGINVKKDSGVKNYWGPTKAGITLRYNL